MAQSRGRYLHLPGEVFKANVERAQKLLRHAAERWARGETPQARTPEILQEILDVFIRAKDWRLRYSFAIDPDWMDWNGGVIPQLLTAVAEERDFALLPVLGDALEDAGCTNADVLEHCRASEPHALSCWVADVLLDRVESSSGAGNEEAVSVGRRYEDACMKALDILQTAVAGWTEEGHPEYPPPPEILSRILRIFVKERFLQPPWGSGKI